VNAQKKAIYRHCSLRADRTTPSPYADRVVEVRSFSDGDEFRLQEAVGASTAVNRNEVGCDAGGKADIRGTDEVVRT